ncbi:MAG: V-type ATP synthase subunit E [Anaerolineaceae bacterium]|nr:MAG: V-type ATP synthase subunit E [Anaerolineaceae bacterium]
MSLEVILKSIETSGEVELAQLQQETETRMQQILAEAEQKAALRHEMTRQTVVTPVAGERARRLHQARLEALQIVAAARDQLVTSALEQTRHCLMELRREPIYTYVLQGLIEEAVRGLGDEELNSATVIPAIPPWLEIDARDEALVRVILLDLDLDLAIKPTLNSWGGVSVHSGDGRIIVTNTLESRLERAMPYLRQELATYFETSRATVAQKVAVTQYGVHNV